MLMLAHCGDHWGSRAADSNVSPLLCGRRRAGLPPGPPEQPAGPAQTAEAGRLTKQAARAGSERLAERNNQKQFNHCPLARARCFNLKQHAILAPFAIFCFTLTICPLDLFICPFGWPANESGERFNSSERLRN